MASLDTDPAFATKLDCLVGCQSPDSDVDWQAAGLVDIGNPDQFHQRQVSRWTRAS